VCLLQVSWLLWILMMWNLQHDYRMYSCLLKLLPLLWSSLLGLHTCLWVSINSVVLNGLLPQHDTSSGCRWVILFLDMEGSSEYTEPSVSFNIPVCHFSYLSFITYHHYSHSCCWCLYVSCCHLPTISSILLLGALVVRVYETNSLLLLFYLLCSCNCQQGKMRKL
jgi:hypothetical protein